MCMHLLIFIGLLLHKHVKDMFHCSVNHNDITIINLYVSMTTYSQHGERQKVATHRIEEADHVKRIIKDGENKKR